MIKRAKQICPICCRQSLDGVVHSRCKNSHDVDGLTAIWSYREKTMRQVIEAIKFGFNQNLVADILADVTLPKQENHVLVPLPLYWYRENWRGFNQAEEVARQLAKKWRLPVVRALERTKNTKQQAKVANKKEREINLAGAFRVVESVKNKKVMLLDDVYTSGASMREAARTLKQAGAIWVWGFVLAH